MLYAVMLRGLDGVYRVWCLEDSIERAESVASHYRWAGVDVKVVPYVK